MNSQQEQILNEIAKDVKHLLADYNQRKGAARALGILYGIIAAITSAVVSVIVAFISRGH